MLKENLNFANGLIAHHVIALADILRTTREEMNGLSPIVRTQRNQLFDSNVCRLHTHNDLTSTTIVIILAGIKLCKEKNY